MKVKNSFRYFQNRECQYYPCHKGADDERFNCLFCYCPLYTLGERCGGNFSYTDRGIKDCSNCTIPHQPKGYIHVIGKFEEVAQLATQNRFE